MASTNWPEIEIPGRGKVEVRFGLSAFYVLQTESKIEADEIGPQLASFFPKTDAEGNVTKKGHINISLLFKLLSACTWKTLRMTPEELAEAVDEPHRLAALAVAVVVAFSKTQWSAPAPLTTAALNGTERAATN